MLQAVLHELKHIFRLGVPLVIAQLAIVGMQVTDTVMAGQVSANDLAALAIGSGLWITISITAMGLLSALSPIIAHLQGADQTRRIARQVHQGVWLSLCVGVIGALLLWCMPWLLQWVNLPTEVAPVTAAYLQSLAPGALAISLTCSLRYFCEAVGRTRPTMHINVIAFLLNIVVDYILVFGVWGLPELGAVGCGWATSFNCVLMLAFFIWHIRRDPFYRPYRLYRHIFPPCWKDIRKHLAIGGPIGVGVGGEVLFFGILALLLAPLGAVVVGGHQVALNLGGLFYMIPLGMCQAVCIRVAFSLGSKHPKQARFIARLGLLQGAAIATVTAIFTLAFRETIADIYSDNSDVITLASRLLVLCAAYQVVDALQILAWGALRGYKDTQVPMWLQLTSYWLVGFPVGYSLSLTTLFTEEPMGATGLWIGLLVGLTTAALLLNARLQWVSRQALNGQLH